MKFRFAQVCLIILTIGIASWFVVTVNKRLQETPVDAENYNIKITPAPSIESTIADYCFKARFGNLSDLDSLLSTIPDSFIRHQLQCEPVGECPKDQPKPKGNSADYIEQNMETVIGGYRDLFGDLFHRKVAENVPARFRSLQMSIVRIEWTKARGDDAQAKVILQEKRGKKTSEAAYSFFLRRDETGWKIYWIVDSWSGSDFPASGAMR